MGLLFNVYAATDSYYDGNFSSLSGPKNQKGSILIQKLNLN